MNLNVVTISGNLVRDPESRDVGGSNVCSFTIANSRKYKTKDGEEKEEAAFIDVQTWAKTAEQCSKYLIKGKPVILEGGLRQQSWTDKDGNKRTKILIRAERVHFLADHRNKERQEAERREPTSRSAAPATAADDSAPPF